MAEKKTKSAEDIAENTAENPVENTKTETAEKPKFHRNAKFVRVGKEYIKVSDL